MIVNYKGRRGGLFPAAVGGFHRIQRIEGQLRVHEAVRPFQAPVEMRARRPAGSAHRADNIAFFHPLARPHVGAGLVRVEARHPVAVGDDRVQTEGAAAVDLGDDAVLASLRY